MKKTFKILAIILVAFGFVACDEVSKVVDSATQKGKQLAQSASNVAQSSNSGGISISVSPSNSICKNYYAKKIGENSFSASSLKRLGPTLDSLGSSSGLVCFSMYDGGCVVNAPKKIFRLYAAEIKKDGNETICVYFDTIGQGYLNTNLTPQEIEQFERYLLEIGISYDEYKEKQDYYLKRLKYFKYFGLSESVYSTADAGTKGNISRVIWLKASMSDIFKNFENDGNIEVIRFIYDKADPGYFNFFNDGTDIVGYTRLSKLRELANESQNNQAVLQWAEEKLRQAK